MPKREPTNQKKPRELAEVFRDSLALFKKRVNTNAPLLGKRTDERKEQFPLLNAEEENRG